MPSLIAKQQLFASGPQVDQENSVTTDWFRIITRHCAMPCIPHCHRAIDIPSLPCLRKLCSGHIHGAFSCISNSQKSQSQQALLHDDWGQKIGWRQVVSKEPVWLWGRLHDQDQDHVQHLKLEHRQHQIHGQQVLRERHRLRKWKKRIVNVMVVHVKFSIMGRQNNFQTDPDEAL